MTGDRRRIFVAAVPPGPDEDGERVEFIDLGDDDPAEDDEAAPRAAGGGRFELRPTRDDNGDRLDRYVAANLDDLSRSYVQQLIETGRIRVDGFVRRPSFKLTVGEVVSVDVPPPVDATPEPEPIPLAIIYEDADLIVLDKPAGLVVHPAPGHPRGTLVNALLHHAPQMSINGTNRPGIVHRLDKDTSGLMVVAKTDRAQTALVRQWADRTVRKGYVALAAGVVADDAATIDAPIGRDPAQRQRMAVHPKGRPAVTHLTTRERFQSTSLLDVEPETGRTHQIRVHLAFIGHPIIGDAVYGHDRASARRRGEPWLPRHVLHAASLGFRLPDGRPVSFESPLPPDLSALVDRERAARAAADQG
jgi:23S rRNA pseudouridine1911/1915/1917 synthase